jgi:putative glutathione S-transferase
MFSNKKYLMGDTLTEVDLKNFAWVTRFDYAYTVIFKAPGGRIAQYPHIAAWVKRLLSEYPMFMLNFGRVVPFIPSIEEWVSNL